VRASLRVVAHRDEERAQRGLGFGGCHEPLLYDQLGHLLPRTAAIDQRHQKGVNPSRRRMRAKCVNALVIESAPNAKLFRLVATRARSSRSLPTAPWIIVDRLTSSSSTRRSEWMRITGSGFSRNGASERSGMHDRCNRKLRAAVRASRGSVTGCCRSVDPAAISERVIDLSSLMFFDRHTPTTARELLDLDPEYPL
jgi:hypothetical protein